MSNNNFLVGGYKMKMYLTATIFWPYLPKPSNGGIDIANARNHIMVKTDAVFSENFEF